MSDDIVAQLIELACISGHSELAEAADEITRLRADLAAARALLKARSDASPQANMTPLLAYLPAAMRGHEDE